jgi:hypothetical protein
VFHSTSRFQKICHSCQNCFPFCSDAVRPLLLILIAVLCLCTCQAFPGPPLLPCTGNHSSTLRIFEYCGWKCPSGVRSVGSSWLLALPLTGYGECVSCQRMDACLPTSGVARRSSFSIPGGRNAMSGARGRIGIHLCRLCLWHGGRHACSGSWPAVSLAARSAVSSPDTPTCAGIYRS